MHECREVVILGSTGSIGQSALDIIRANPREFRVMVLAAGTNIDLLLQQIILFEPQFISVANENAGERLLQLSYDLSNTYLARLFREGRVFIGEDSAREVLAQYASVSRVAKKDVLVIGAIVGIAGLSSSLEALRHGYTLLLANKESIVCGGHLIREHVESYGGCVVPVDSEHSSIAQLMEGIRSREVRYLHLTASGGPFLNFSVDQLDNVTAEMAVKHPRWSMGAKISVDSSTLVNKALEVAEACWFFQCDEEKIKVIIHPESIVHSIVELIDGVQLAHLGVADMKGPIGYAMCRPKDRIRDVIKPLVLPLIGSLSFYELDDAKFPAISYMRQCLRVGKGMPVIFNAANEAAVELFLLGKLSWKGIVRMIALSLEHFTGKQCGSFQDILELHNEVVEFVRARGVITK